MSLAAAFLTMALCQLFKFIKASLRAKRILWANLFHTGGMPSSHSAFTSALMVSVGMMSGFDSDAFALAAVFGAIVMYDAWRLRGAVQKQGEALLELMRASNPAVEAPFIKNIGHSLSEIASGLAVGAASALLLVSLSRALLGVAPRVSLF